MSFVSSNTCTTKCGCLSDNIPQDKGIVLNVFASCFIQLKQAVETLTLRICESEKGKRQVGEVMEENRKQLRKQEGKE